MEFPEARASVEPFSATAVAIRKWAEARIVMFDQQLRQTGLPLDETEGLRYAIAELEQLKRLVAPDES